MHLVAEQAELQAKLFQDTINKIVADGIAHELEHCDNTVWVEFQPNLEQETVRIPNVDLVALNTMHTWGIGHFGKYPERDDVLTGGFAPYDAQTVGNDLYRRAETSLIHARYEKPELSTAKYPLWPAIGGDTNHHYTCIPDITLSPFVAGTQTRLVKITCIHWQALKVENIPGKILNYNQE